MTAFKAACVQLRSSDDVAENIRETVRWVRDGAIGLAMVPVRRVVAAFPRLVREVATSAGRDVRLVIRGESTPVDREVLRRLDAPLGHLLRNAIDHGVEPSDDRLTQGEPAIDERGLNVGQGEFRGGTPHPC